MRKEFVQLSKGNKSAFDTIYSATKKRVFYIVYSIVRNYETAEELMDDVYVKLLNNPTPFAQSSSPLGYLYVTAKNLALNCHKRDKKIVFENIDDHMDLHNNKNDFEALNIPIFALSKKVLEPDEFQVIMLCEIANFKRREVAKMMELSTSGVTYKRDVALKKLKKALEGEQQ